jgi:hypothetical protein
MSDCPNYEYYIYSALGLIIVVSETLGLTNKIPQNSILALLYDGAKIILRLKKPVVENNLLVDEIK